MTTENIRNREDLVRAVRSGLTLEYLFFWGHKPLPSGEIGKSCFSQWWPAPFVVEGLRYPTAEHFMMAEKARLFADKETRAHILTAESPKVAKELGRKVKRFDEQVWQAARFQLVVEGNLAKFSQHAELRRYLLATNDNVLVEASPVDRVWGIGMAADHGQVRNPEQWRGMNLLGFALMEVRRLLAGSRY